MSPQAYVDPERLRAFSSELTVLASRISDLDNELQRSLVQLGETFRDEEYERFRRRFAASRQQLQRFVDDVRAMAPRLVQDADDIRASQQVQLDR